MARASTTVNPLHFEDLEPHRFEDLVRQLAYDFREWRMLEATGRLGGDEGFDVRAWEDVRGEEDEEGAEEEEKTIPRPEGRLWAIQCKRMRRIPPKKMAEYVKEVRNDTGAPLYGIILAAPCEFSKKARDLFAGAVRDKAVQEFYLWGKAELEDMLFQPKNDHLLFAYFGFSLRIRRRSLKTQIRSRLVPKRKVVGCFGDVRARRHETVLIRDADDTYYPYKGDIPHFDDDPRWWPYVFLGHYHSGIELLERRYYAYLADDLVHWDFVPMINTIELRDNPWRGGASVEKQREIDQQVWKFWSSIPQQNRAWFELVRHIPYERIVDIDKDGDVLATYPHLYVERDVQGSRFEDGARWVLHPCNDFGPSLNFPKKEDKIVYFPKQFPESGGCAPDVRDPESGNP